MTHQQVTFGKATRGSDNGQPTSTTEVFVGEHCVGIIEADYDRVDVNLEQSHFRSAAYTWRITHLDYTDLSEGIEDLNVIVTVDGGPTRARTQIQSEIRTKYAEFHAARKIADATATAATATENTDATKLQLVTAMHETLTHLTHLEEMLSEADKEWAGYYVIAARGQLLRRMEVLGIANQTF